MDMNVKKPGNRKNGSALSITGCFEDRNERFIQDESSWTSYSDVNFLMCIKDLAINYMDENVIVLGNVFVPMYVKFIAELGSKFSYCPDQKDLQKDDTSICLDYISEMIDDYEAWCKFSKFKANFEYKGFCGITKAQKFIKLQFLRTRRFLKNNGEIMIVSADKGGKVVITTKDVYEEKMGRFIDDCSNSKIFFKIPISMDFNQIRNYVEDEYDKLRATINPYLLLDMTENRVNPSYQLVAEPYVIARLYGLFKIHKEGIPVRPIISTTDCMGKNLMNWLLKKLKLITSAISFSKVIYPVALFDMLNGYNLSDSSRLYTSDFDNMYTNINFGKTKNIIREYYHLIAEETTVPVDIFLMALAFFIEIDAYFLYGGNLYRQCRGLAMGNSLSGILAEIYLNSVLNKVIMDVPNDSLDFLFIFMDDLIYATSEGCVQGLVEEVVSLSGINLKTSGENEENSVNYLNMNVMRNARDGNKLEIKWWHKPESCCKILNYHSFHPFSMKMNVITEFIRNSLRLTSSFYWDETIDSVKRILSNSGYSSTIIKKKVFKVCKEIGEVKVSSSVGHVDLDVLSMYDSMITNENVFTSRKYSALNGAVYKDYKYLSVPYHPAIIQSVRTLLRELKITNVKIAPKMIIKNKSTIFSNSKDRRDLSNRVDSIFRIKCLRCDLSWNFKTVNLDVKRSFKHQLMNEMSGPFLHRKSNPDHDVIVDHASIKKFKSKNELRLFRF